MDRMTLHRTGRPASPLKTTACALAAFGCLAFTPLTASATSKDGIFPSASEVGGQVYVQPLTPGSPFPRDIDVYDLSGKQMDIGQLLGHKRTVVAFFITAAPASVHEVKKLQDFVQTNARGVQVLNVNADTVGVALQGGPGRAVAATARTLRVYEKEAGLKNLYVAPNDALDPHGLSNRLGFRGLPTIFVLKADGTIEKVFVGPQNWKKGDI